MEWNVYIENVNKREIERYNIFQYFSLTDEIRRIKKETGSKEEFAKELDNELKYRFWSKCEWEIILSDWPPSAKFHKEKIDVYDQLKMNWDVFVDYVWNNI